LIWGVNANRTEPIAVSKRYPAIKYFFKIWVGVSADLLCPRRAPATVCARKRHINRLFFGIGAYEKGVIYVKQRQNILSADPRIVDGQKTTSFAAAFKTRKAAGSCHFKSKNPVEAPLVSPSQYLISASLPNLKISVARFKGTASLKPRR
jgi:hypothetical protein